MNGELLYFFRKFNMSDEYDIALTYNGVKTIIKNNEILKVTPGKLICNIEPFYIQDNKIQCCDLSYIDKDFLYKFSTTVILIKNIDGEISTVHDPIWINRIKKTFIDAKAYFHVK